MDLDGAGGDLGVVGGAAWPLAAAVALALPPNAQPLLTNGSSELLLE